LSIDPAQACENVQARQANQDRQYRSHRDFRRRDPQLRTAGETADNDAVRQHAKQRE
jgi:hypothetical protein